MKSVTSLPLSDLFDFPSIKGLTEEFIIKNPGDIPVFGGRMTETPIGFIADDLPGVKYFSDCLAWNREGSVGYVFFHKGRFSTNDHHRPLILREKYKNYVDLDYARIVLQKLLLSQGFVWSKTASKEKVMEMSIDVPIKANGLLDMDQQKELVTRYKKMDTIQKKLSKYIEDLNKAVIIEEKYPKKTVFLSDECFSISIGKRVLKQDLVSDGIPVYSANPKVPIGRIKESNNSDFSKPSLLWGIDGNYEWGYIPENSVFSNTDHCGRLQVNDPSILSEFVYYQLRESNNSYGFNRSYRASLKNITSVSINIPIDSNGDFNVNTQKKLISSYRKIDEVKSRLTILLQQATIPSVDI